MSSGASVSHQLRVKRLNGPNTAKNVTFCYNIKCWGHLLIYENISFVTMYIRCLLTMGMKKGPLSSLLCGPKREICNSGLTWRERWFTISIINTFEFSLLLIRPCLMYSVNSVVLEIDWKQ